MCFSHNVLSSMVFVKVLKTVVAVFKCCELVVFVIFDKLSKEDVLSGSKRVETTVGVEIADIARVTCDLTSFPTDRIPLSLFTVFYLFGA